MSVILCSGNRGALTPATTLPASVRKARLATSRPVGVSRGISHVPISGAASAGDSGAAAVFAAVFPAGGVAALLPAWGCSVVPAARAEPLVTTVASNRYVGILRSIKVLLK